MSEQLQLELPTRRREPKALAYRRALSLYQQTSRDAWYAIQPELGAIDARILRHVSLMMRTGYSGATSDEVECAERMPHQTVSAQIRHMAAAGLLVDSGERRPTRSGRGAVVWCIG